MIKNWAFSVLLSGMVSPLSAQSYSYSVDLNKVSSDQVSVHLTPPPLPSGPVTFHLPKIVPGTYSIYDFGRFVTQFSATDGQGNPITVSHPDPNSWVFPEGNQVASLVYSVEDTWDSDQDNTVFEPGGSNFEAGKNFFLNNHAVFGYFEGFQHLPFTLNFEKPAGFFGATTLSSTESSPTRDQFRAKNYFELADNPIMFCAPDTTLLSVGGAEILFAIYSPSHELTSKFVASEIAPILEAQKAYLGGKLPIERYAFIIYLFNGFSQSGSYGALEHNTCSMYYLPEYGEAYIAQTLRDFSAHEFFHVITPLSIHSEEIHNFDFIHPKMSQHLWLYEGMTEYAAGHVQIKQGIISFDDYLAMIQEKIVSAYGYNDTLPFTEMSSGVLDTYEDEYGNVYQKGALIGLCLDILLRKESKGQYGTQNLMADLAKEYGRDKPFVDNALFAKIEALTYPSIGEFLRKHVSGKEPLPLTEILGYAGIFYASELTTQEFSLGDFGVDVNEENQVYIDNAYRMDEFGRKMGFKTGDILNKIDGKQVTLRNYYSLSDHYFETHQEGDVLEVEVLRPKNKRGKKRVPVVLSAPIFKVERTRYEVLKAKEAPTPEELELQKAWLGDFKH